MDKSIKILHLEDSIKDSELVQLNMNAGGIQYNYFLTDSEKGYSTILETESIDIILADYCLPEYSGSEALKLAKKKYPLIPFVYVSGSMGEDIAIIAMLNGATDYVLKHRMERLVPAIKRALNEVALEKKSKLAEDSLKVSEVRYRRLFESAKDGILILNAENGEIVDVNPFLIDLLGYSKEDFIEKKNLGDRVLTGLDCQL
jgi:DNA-binding NtrC family response regulator